MSPALDLYAPPQRRRPADAAKDQRLPQTSPLVNYRYGIDPEQSCGTCTMFQPPGGCAAVTGMIRPVDTCDLWEKDPAKTPPVSEPWALPAEQGPNGVSQAPEVDDPEQLQQPGNPEDPTQAGVYAPQPRKGVVGPVRASLAGAREPAQAYFAHRDPAQAYFMREPAQGYFKEAWDADAHPRDEEGQFTGAGGRAPGGTKKSKAAFLASRYVQLHNAAAKEYKAAFKAVGANMWHGDDAHPLKQHNEDSIRDTMGGMIGGPAAAGKIYSIARPLTVLDSYPNVTRAQRVQLDKRVGTIGEKYSKQWKKSLRMAKESVSPVHATLVEAGTREGGRKGSLTRRGRNALMRRLAKSEREISLGHVKMGKVRV